MEQQAANTNDYGTVWQLVIPFLPVDESFPNLILVNKASRETSLRLLHEHCQKHHPIVLLFEERNRENLHASLSKDADSNSSQDDTNRNGIHEHWLTYGRYCSFTMAQTPGTILLNNYFQPNSVNHDWIEDYEVALEIHVANEGQATDDVALEVFFYDIQPLRVGWHSLECAFDPDNYPVAGRDSKKGMGASAHHNLFLYQKSTGKVFTILKRSMHGDNKKSIGFSYNIQGPGISRPGTNGVSFKAMLSVALFRDGKFHQSLTITNRTGDRIDLGPVNFRFSQQPHRGGPLRMRTLEASIRHI
ncbi:expressed unknown protein [Seminavis robusta]|uniref:Uncharacterized protein n=1 Tax=Seminavis robusta TaxID=568900 RepID=A0A9N8DYS1_9STRA|nr:expressed unknown protein [Seminavis robusta]|eukprot:Sro349_g123460.1 n/a (303) ;mRNA; f:37412-38320